MKAFRMIAGIVLIGFLVDLRAQDAKPQTEVRQAGRELQMKERLASLREARSELRRQAQQEIVAASASTCTTKIRQELTESLEEASLTSREQARKVADELKNLRGNGRRL